MPRSYSILKLFCLYMAPATFGEEGGGGGGDLPDDDADSEGGETDRAPEDEEEADSADEAVDQEEVDDSGEELPPDDDDEDGEGALSVTIAGEEAGAEDEEDLSDMTPKARKRWAEMRINLRNEKRARKEAEERAAANQKPAVEAEDPGPEPDIGDAGIDFDAEAFATKYKEWAGKQAAAEKVKERRKQDQDRSQEVWRGTVEAYKKAATKLGAVDFKDAEDAVMSTLSTAQQVVILEATDSPEKVVYALGKSQKHLAKVAEIQNLVKFTAAIVKLETKMTVTTRKAPPAPERVLKSSVAGAAAVDNPLERLREQARKTGNYNKVIEHQRNQQEKARKKSAA